MADGSTDGAIGTPVGADEDAASDVAPDEAAVRRPVRTWRGRRYVRRLLLVVVIVCGTVVTLAVGGFLALTAEYRGTVSPAAHGTGHDAEWLGHAWVDGRKSQADIDRLAAQLRDTGIHDLFVHSGPLRDDGTLDPDLLPNARWLTAALHAALPGVRVQAWLGAHPVPGQLSLSSPASRANVVAAVGQVLDDGFDGVHYDFEPVMDGDQYLLAMLQETHALTRQRHRFLSVSAIHTEPMAGVATGVSLLPGRLALWSSGYLHQVAMRVDQVAVMAYDTGLPTQAAYGGYVRRATAAALDAVPVNVTLFIGVPAYHDEHLTHHRGAETVAAALRGVRLALGADPPTREVGVAMYVDFAATPQDWDSYHHDWADLAGGGRG